MKNKRDYRLNPFATLVCPVCGQTFVKQHHWAYNVKKGDHSVRVCSYSCMRKVQKEQEAKGAKM